MDSSITSRGLSRRRDLLTAARRVVADGGFQSLQMTTVAAAAGTAVGTIYRYFPAKAELCAALVAQVSSRELEVLQEVVAAEKRAPVALANAVAVFARRALAERRLAYAMIAEPVEPAVDAERLVWRKRIGEALAEVIARGSAEGAFRACDPQLAAACVTGAFMEALVGPLSPSLAHNREAYDARALSLEIAALCRGMLANPSLQETDDDSP